MKKLFLLIPVLAFALMAKAVVTNIDNSTPDALRLALHYANDGDVIVMAEGVYEESNSNYIAFNAKNVTVKAADGANVVIKPHVPFTVSGGARAEIQGVKIDASELCSLGSYSHLMYASDAAANNRLILDGCEIYGFALNNSMIYCSSSNALDALTINNCYFHNINKSCVFIENTSNAIAISITNSTFANITTDAGSYYAGVIDTRATSGSFLVDHCTFYNVEAMSTGYAAIGQVKLASGATVSNCIFALSASGASSNRAIRDAVAANNCLVYNYSTDGGYGMQSNVTKTGCFIADPLFADAANGDFSLAGNWVTMELSPARGAATDGSDLGDPRWAGAETLPSTDFASPYILLGEKAILSGNFALNGDNFIQAQGHAEAGIATWKIHAERKGTIQATLNIDANNGSGHRFEIEVTNAENAIVANIAEAADSWSKGDQILGSIEIPEAGDYKIVLKNYTSYSATILEGITLSYLGGAVVPVSPSVNTTLDIADAVFSGCTRDAGFIQFPSSGTSSAWIKWNISTSATAFYDFTLNIDAPNAHGLTVEIFENESAPAIASVSEGSYVSSTGVLALELGRVNLAGDKNYIVKVTNAPSGSIAKITSLIFAPVVSTAVVLPTALDNNDAVLSEKAHITDGHLYFAPIGDTNPVGQWAAWSVSADHNGTYLFALNVNSDNGQSYKISILDAGNNVIDFCEKDLGSGEKTLNHYFSLEEGDYSIKVENTKAWSHGYVISLDVTEPDLTVIDQTETTAHELAVAQNIQIIRTFTGGMFNTICLPFGINSTKLKNAFGDDVELKVFAGADFDEATSALDLNFNDATSSGIYQGTPYLIKPSHDIKNPVFESVEISVTEAGSSTGDFANFHGTLVAT
ncbi:MAG: DUF4957 domain-containing protein, partial [Bacteroidales bacterium]|nr:DUF4957 domain-containing protein [Bacteroidales bacterium]